MVLISTFIFREVENLYSFFKRYNQYINFIELVSDEIENKCNISHKKIKLEEIAGVILDLMKSKEFEKKQKDIYNKYNTICLIARTQPKVLNINSKGYADLYVLEEKVDGEKRLISISELSPSLHAISCEAKKEQLFNIFLIGKNIKENSELIDRIKSEIVSLIIQYYIDDTNFKPLGSA